VSTEKTKSAPTTVINIAPIASPINPYEFGRRYLLAARQDTDTPEVKAGIEERVKYMQFLQRKLAPLETVEPILCLALMRAALDVRARAFLTEALRIQTEQIPKLAKAKPAVKPDQVIEHPPAILDELAAAKKRIAELEAKAFTHPEPAPPAKRTKPPKADPAPVEPEPETPETT
jgi:hypothetical protein